jgi:predicted Zn-dependent protease
MKTRTLIVSGLVLGAASAAFAFGLGDLAKSVAEHTVEKAADPNTASKWDDLTIQQEIDIGDSVSVEIVARYGGIWKDKVATQRVNLVGRTLARYAKRDSLDWRFGLLDSDAVNAFSAPNGRVFITKGLYKLLANDDELAGVLAHEISHADLRHAAAVIRKANRAGVIKDVGSSVANDAVAGSGAAGLPMVSQLVEQGTSVVVKGLFVDGYPKESEFEADRTGYELAKTTGFNSNGLRAALTKVEANTAKAKETFNTHPSTKERLKKLPGGDKKKGK